MSTLSDRQKFLAVGLAKANQMIELCELLAFLRNRIDEDESAALAYPASTPRKNWPRDAFEAWIRNEGRTQRAEAAQAAALNMRCPTCHAQRGQGCMTMRPPLSAPKTAAEMHALRFDLGAAEIHRTQGPRSHAHYWTTERMGRESVAKRKIVGNAEGCKRITEALRSLSGIYIDHPDFPEIQES